VGTRSGVIHKHILEANRFARAALLEDGGGVLLLGKHQPAEHHAHQNYPDLGMCLDFRQEQASPCFISEVQHVRHSTYLTPVRKNLTFLVPSTGYLWRNKLVNNFGFALLQ